MPPFTAERSSCCRSTRRARTESRRHLRVVQPLHQVGQCGQQRRRNAINHPMPAKDEPTDREPAAYRSRAPGQLQRGCATPSKLTTGATWCPWRCCVLTGSGVPTGIRTPVTSVKGMCPRPLDDGDSTDFRDSGGARRDRTADLLHAMQALSQLSYGPIPIKHCISKKKAIKLR